jgi:hypothetical protein
VAMTWCEGERTRSRMERRANPANCDPNCVTPAEALEYPWGRLLSRHAAVAAAAAAAAAVAAATGAEARRARAAGLRTAGANGAAGVKAAGAGGADGARYHGGDDDDGRIIHGSGGGGGAGGWGGDMGAFQPGCSPRTDEDACRGGSHRHACEAETVTGTGTGVGCSHRQRRRRRRRQLGCLHVDVHGRRDPGVGGHEIGFSDCDLGVVRPPPDIGTIYKYKSLAHFVGTVFRLQPDQ